MSKKNFLSKTNFQTPSASIRHESINNHYYVTKEFDLEKTEDFYSTEDLRKNIETENISQNYLKMNLYDESDDSENETNSVHNYVDEDRTFVGTILSTKFHSFDKLNEKNTNSTENNTKGRTKTMLRKHHSTTHINFPNICSITRECIVCLLTKDEEEFSPRYSNNCTHFIRDVCNLCVYNTLKNFLNQTMNSQMICPENECGAKLNFDEIRQILIENNDYLLLNKYDSYLMKKELEQYDDFFWCAHGCGSGQIVNSLSNRNTKITCVECGKDTCAFHRVKWHNGLTCKQYDKLDKSTNSTAIKWIKKHTKKCPKCKCNIEKIGGCDHMVCKNCQCIFCWYCLSDCAHYQHLRRFEHKISCKHHPFGKFILPVRLLNHQKF